MLIDGRLLLHRPRHVANRHMHANAIGHALRHLNLVEVARRVVINRRPAQTPQVRYTKPRLRLRKLLAQPLTNLVHLVPHARPKLRLEPRLMHLIQRRLRQIEMVRVNVLMTAMTMLLMRRPCALVGLLLRAFVFLVPMPMVFRHSTKLTRLYLNSDDAPPSARTIALWFDPASSSSTANTPPASLLASSSSSPRSSMSSPPTAAPKPSKPFTVFRLSTPSLSTPQLGTSPARQSSPPYAARRRMFPSL